MLKGSKTQITIAQRYQGTKSSGGGGHGHGGKSEAFELQGPGGAKIASNCAETIVDDMVYRKTARLIATVDITYSSFMVALQLIGLIIGASHSSNVKAAAEADPSSTFTSQQQQQLHFSGGNQRNAQPSDPSQFTPKIRETIAVMVWTALFTVCILQLVVAGALYGGTNERDGRKCIRNCRMWCMTTIFLALLIFCQIFAILVVLHPRKHVWLLIVLTGELSFRLIALFFIKKFIAELVIEYCDDGDSGEPHVQYEPLCPSPAPILKNSAVNNGMSGMQYNSNYMQQQV